MLMCEPAAAAEEEEPDVVSEPKEEFTPQRDRTPPEHYNPASGRSYAQVVANHNVVTQAVEKDNTFDYQDAEAGILAWIITHECHQHMFMLPKAVKKFGGEGVKAAKDEVWQLHTRGCFKALAVKELTRLEKERAVDGIICVSQKQTGKHKGTLAYNGKPTREWISCEDKSSPTAYNESIFLT